VAHPECNVAAGHKVVTERIRIDREQLARLPKSHLTTHQASERLQVTEDTVRRWLRSGRIRGRRLNDRAGYRIPRDEIERVLREGFPEDSP
jgi:excisionase family DNA binding protein